MIRRILKLIEFTLVFVGVTCLGAVGSYLYASHRFQETQVQAFERGEAASTGMPGALLGILSVPRLGLSTVVVEGDDSSSLKFSAGHLLDTPWPWQNGNSAIAAHRDGEFRELRTIKVGDEIRMQTSRGDFIYTVRELSIVEPDDLSVLATHEPASLTLITCYPFNYVGSAPKRFVVRAERQNVAIGLIGNPVPPSTGTGATVSRNSQR